MKLIIWLFLISTCLCQADPTTQRLYLSGKGPADAVDWDFEISEGRRAGEKAKIPVPSQWEQHGFGGYDYGSVAIKDQHKESGLYRRNFTIPNDWRDKVIRIVFEGAMTDTTVKVNGQQAGTTHQGGFYRFEYDITDKVRFGESNELEVLVSKLSSNHSVNEAERHSDYWVFGGIFRPVWIEALPKQFIDWTSTDAKADGSLRARVYLGGNGDADRILTRVSTLDGKPVGEAFSAPLNGHDPVDLSGSVTGIEPWSAEFPRLYQVDFSLMHGDQELHRSSQHIGFRTLEIRQGKGVFVNGTRIAVKGVNRHSFRPESGRALDPEQCYEDVRLLKEMNMNAVRSSHYPPDKVFLDACDELGLYVIDELCTWQKPSLDTPTATRLIRQIVRRDANHPSILWWANGNEGGWNTAVDGEFPRWDIQQRPVLHPWDPFSGFQTKHYPSWNDLNRNLAGDLLVMPTEYLHGLYDGGHGAGLEDFWQAITSTSNGVGGFLWVLADEGIMRTDRNGEIDTWGTNAPDGIVGPHHEKEASFFTIKDIFCPVQISIRELPANFDGNLEVTNRYDFRNLTSVTFAWQVTGAAGSRGGTLPTISVAPGARGFLTIPLPGTWKEQTALQLTATDSDGQPLWTWSWAIHAAGSQPLVSENSAAPAVIADHGMILAKTGNGISFQFDGASGRLIKATRADQALSLTNGPRFVGSNPAPALPFIPVKIAKATSKMAGDPAKSDPARAIDDQFDSAWSQEGRDSWLQLEFSEPTAVNCLAVAWQKASERKASYALLLSDDGKEWIEVLRGDSTPDETGYDIRKFKQHIARFARLRGFGNSQNSWNSILELRIGNQDDAKPTTSESVSHRMNGDRVVIDVTSDGPLKDFRWTLHPDGQLDLDYNYQLDQAAPFHGITFDLPENEMRKFTWTGQGPRRVWRNRMRGTRFGDFEIPFKVLRPSHDFDYPHARGYFAGIHDAKIETASGTIEIIPQQENTFIRLGTNDEGEKIHTYWPAGDLSILHGIPAIGTKFKTPEQLGPQSQFNPAPGSVTGKVVFRFTK